MSTNVEFTAYYMVSTQRQGQSGLGLAAQQQAVVKFIGQPPTSEFTEIESGRRHENRPELKRRWRNAGARDEG